MNKKEKEALVYTTLKNMFEKEIGYKETGFCENANSFFKRVSRGEHILATLIGSCTSTPLFYCLDKLRYFEILRDYVNRNRILRDSKSKEVNVIRRRAILYKTYVVNFLIKSDLKGILNGTTATLNYLSMSFLSMC